MKPQDIVLLHAWFCYLVAKQHWTAIFAWFAMMIVARILLDVALYFIKRRL